MVRAIVGVASEGGMGGDGGVLLDGGLSTVGVGVWSSKNAGLRRSMLTDVVLPWRWMTKYLRVRRITL